MRAEALGVSRKNIYRPSKQEQKDLLLKTAIEEVHKKHPSYGHKRVALELQLNHKKIRRVMRKYGIKPPRRKVHHYCTRSTSHHTYTNLIKGLYPKKLHELWCSDVSFLKYQGKFWYLITIVDVTSRQVVAADVGKKHDSALTLRVIKQAINNTKHTPAIFHSDQGTEFMAKRCTNYLESLSVKVSASDKASPWQNGYQESFFGKFKDEIGDLNRFETVGELIEEIYHHIHYYNNERIHTALKMPPAVYASSLRDMSS
ncbi:MAG: IS3 family transposase [Rhabdochlamydiaceae bacterium]